MTVGASIMLLLLLGGASDEERCTGEISIRGDAELADRLRTALARRHVLDDETCTKEISIEKDEEQIVLAMRDDERTTVRRMNSMSSSAVAVESWLRDDLAAPLLSPRAIPRPVRMPFQPEFDESSRSVVEQKEEREGLELMLSMDWSYASDASVWGGASAGGCYPLDFVCLGLTVGFAVDTRTPETIKRLAFDFGMLAEAPFDLGPIRVRPGVELGAHWMRSVRYVSHDDVDIKSWNFRAGLYVGAHIPITDAMGVGIALNAAVLPQAHTGEQYDDGYTLPGEPRFYAGIGIGIEGTTR